MRVPRLSSCRPLARAHGLLLHCMSVTRLWHKSTRNTGCYRCSDRRTLLLLLLLLCSNQTLTKFLLLLVEACSTVWRDVGKGRCAIWALHSSSRSERPRADCDGMGRWQATKRLSAGTTSEHGGGDDVGGGAVEVWRQLTKLYCRWLGAAKESKVTACSDANEKAV